MSGMNFFFGGGGRYQGCWQELGLGPTSWFKQMAAINVLHLSLILLNKTKWARIIREMNKINIYIVLALSVRTFYLVVWAFKQSGVEPKTTQPCPQFVD